MATKQSATPLELKRLGEGIHPAGDGLYLQVSKSGTRSWLYRYQIAGKRRAMGLGSAKLTDSDRAGGLSLKQARDKRDEYRLKVSRGIDPLAEREAQKQAEAAEQAKAESQQSETFEAFAGQYIKTKRAEWKNTKHGDQWENTLRTYAYPTIGSVHVSEIKKSQVFDLLEPIWTTKTETASRVRNRIELVLDFSYAKLELTGIDNPARWRGYLDKLLPKPKKITKVRNHPALPIDEMPAFIAALRLHEGMSPLALEFLILTAARTGEVLGAKWEEIDEVAQVWKVPPERMKGKREHQVPLTPAALAVLEKAKNLRMENNPYIFGGPRKEMPLSNMSLNQLVRGMSCDGLNEGEPPRWRDAKGQSIVPHGFRSAFRDWVAERTEYSETLAEMALAHVIKNQTEAAYRRGNMLERRRPLMADWATFCEPPKSEQETGPN
nr:integrase arm-type DNA-binding domain-containing protein [Dechloromonas sp.]